MKEISAQVETFEPQMSPEMSANLYEGWQEAVEATMHFKHRPLK